MASHDVLVNPQTDPSTDNGAAGGGGAAGSIEVLWNDSDTMSDVMMMLDKARMIIMKRYTAISRD